MVVPALMGADEAGHIARMEDDCVQRWCRAPVVVISAQLKKLGQLIRGLRGSDLLIVLERPPPEERGLLSIGIAGRGFRGNLTSASTRTEGYVLATDIAATVLEHFDADIPAAMTGRPISSGEERDFAALVSLEQRLMIVAERRGPVIGVTALAWILGLLGTLAFDLLRGATSGPRPRRPGPAFAVGLKLLCLSAIYLPAILLLSSALRPGLGEERLLLMLGGPILAALTLWLAPGWRAVAIACAVTVLSHAVDVVAGSPLISLSLMGPNPGLGVRFYGIGNELGATLSVLILLGTGAGLAGFAPGLRPNWAAGIFLAAALPLAGIFAAGRFGADVGSAMVIPAGGAMAAAFILRRPRLILATLAVPVLGLALLVLIDLVSGGDSHFQRSVLDSEDSGDLLDTVARRLRLTGRSFVRAASGPFLPITAIVIALGVFYRGRVRAWLLASPLALRAAVAAAAFATVLGTVVNDSGVLLLEVGTAFLMLVAGYAWAMQCRPSAPEAPSDQGAAQAQSVPGTP